MSKEKEKPYSNLNPIFISTIMLIISLVLLIGGIILSTTGSPIGIIYSIIGSIGLAMTIIIMFLFYSIYREGLNLSKKSKKLGNIEIQQVTSSLNKCTPLIILLTSVAILLIGLILYCMGFLIGLILMVISLIGIGYIIIVIYRYTLFDDKKTKSKPSKAQMLGDVQVQQKRRKIFHLSPK